MADVVTRLKVESSEYDQKLSRATQQLQHMEKEVRRTGATFAYADKEELAFAQSLGQMETKTSSAKGQLREMTDALMSLTQTYKALTDEEKNSPFGQALSASINQLKGRAAEVKDAMADMNRELSGMASDTQAFDQIAGGVTLMTSVIQVGQGALQAFGVENEEAAQAIAKLQGVMAITSGLQQIQNALQKESNVMLGVSKVQTLAAAAAETVANKAKQANIVATKAATVAQKALNLVANANPYVLLATAVVAVTSALWAMSKASKAAKEAEEQREKAAEEAAQKADAQRQSFVDASAEAMGTASRISALQVAYQKSNSEMEKTGVLKQAQDEFKKLGISCNSVTEAQTLLMSKGGQIIELLKMQGTIAALNAIRMEKYKESFKNLLAQGYDVAGAAALAGANKEVRELDAQIISMQTKSQNLKGDLGVGKKQSKSAPKVAVEPVIPEGSAAALKKQISDLQKKWDNATTQGERDSLKGQIEAAQKELDAMTPKVEPVAAAIKDAASMWNEHSEKIADIKARLAEFQAMMADTSLSDGQRAWAEDMAKSYQEQLDKMTGATTEAVDTIAEKMAEIPDSFEAFKEGVGAVSDIVGAMENLKKIGDDLAEAFSGEMSTWDALMTVLNSGIGIMQTVMSVMEAINTLTELSTSLKQANTIATQTEATTSVTAAATEAGAETVKAGANMATAGTAAAASSAEAGEAVAGIPIVGPILAVAAIAAVLTATFAAMSKAKSAGKGFAFGGMVEGNSYSGDNIVARLNAGEGVLTSKGVENAAAMANNSNPMGGLYLTTDVSGSDLRIVLNNDNRSKGGSRNYYSKVH